MNKAIEYVRANEQTEVIQFVHVHILDAEHAATAAVRVQSMVLPAVDAPHNSLSETYAAMHDDVATLQRIYPKMKLDLVVISSYSQFKGSLVKKISDRLDVPPHFMFISCPRYLPTTLLCILYIPLCVVIILFYDAVCFLCGVLIATWIFVKVLTLFLSLLNRS